MRGNAVTGLVALAIVTWIVRPSRGNNTAAIIDAQANAFASMVRAATTPLGTTEWRDLRTEAERFADDARAELARFWSGFGDSLRAPASTESDA